MDTTWSADLFSEESGWTGIFTRNEAKGAFPNGTRIYKVVKLEGDTFEQGAEGVVIGSLEVPEDMKAEMEEDYAYFIEWDQAPKIAIAIMGSKIDKR